MSDASYWFESCLQTLDGLKVLGTATKAELCGVVWTFANGCRFNLPPGSMGEVLGILRKAGYVDLKGAKYTLAKPYRPAPPEGLRAFYRDAMGGILITEIMCASGRVHLYPKEDAPCGGYPEITWAPLTLFRSREKAREARALALRSGFETKEEKPRDFCDQFESVVIGTRDWSKLRALAELHRELSYQDR